MQRKSATSDQELLKDFDANLTRLLAPFRALNARPPSDASAKKVDYAGHHALLLKQSKELDQLKYKLGDIPPERRADVERILRVEHDRLVLIETLSHRMQRLDESRKSIENNNVDATGKTIGKRIEQAQLQLEQNVSPLEDVPPNIPREIIEKSQGETPDPLARQQKDNLYEDQRAVTALWRALNGAVENKKKELVRAVAEKKASLDEAIRRVGGGR